MNKNTDKKARPVKRYLLLTTGFPPARGGIAEYGYNFVKALDGKITVLTMDGDSSADAAVLYAGLHDFKIIRLGILRVRPPWLRDFIFLMAAVFINCGGRFDKLICAHIQLGGAALFLKNIFALPYILIFHGVEVMMLGKEKINSVVDGAFALISVSQYTRQTLLPHVGCKDVEVIPPMLNEEILAHAAVDFDFKQSIGLAGKRIILTVGRLDLASRHKGHDLVLMALPEVLARHPDAVYVIVGDGDGKKPLQELARSLKLTPHVVFYPFDRAGLHHYYQHCDVFIMPSRKIRASGQYEGFGIVFLEAALFKKPVIAGRSGGVVDAVVDGETGLLVDPCDPADIAKAINRLLDDPTYGNRLGEAGYQRVVTEFSLKALAPKIRRLVEGDAHAL